MAVWVMVFLVSHSAVYTVRGHQMLSGEFSAGMEPLSLQFLSSRILVPQFLAAWVDLNSRLGLPS